MKSPDQIYFAVVSNPHEPHWRVQSRHRTEEAAEKALCRVCARTLALYPNANVALMWGIKVLGPRPGKRARSYYKIPGVP